MKQMNLHRIRDISFYITLPSETREMLRSIDVTIRNFEVFSITVLLSMKWNMKKHGIMEHKRIKNVRRRGTS